MLEVLKRGPQTIEREVSIDTIDSPRVTIFDITGDRRDFIEIVDAKDFCTIRLKWISMWQDMFQQQKFGIGAGCVATPILLALKNQLMEVDLLDFVAGRLESEALEVMNIFSSSLEGCVLKYPNLSDNAMGEKGVRKFGDLLKSQSSLEELYLMNDDISEKSRQEIFEFIPFTEKLRVLRFHKNLEVKQEEE